MQCSCMSFTGYSIDGSLSNIINYVFLFQGIDGVPTEHFWYIKALIAMYSYFRF